MENHRVKSLSLDPNSRNRFRYATQKQRERRATADVYRGYKRRIGVASSANREEALHHTTPSSVKKARLDSKQEETRTSTGVDFSELQSASLAEELDLAFDRNPSEIFGKFYRQIWYHVRSLPEIIHHQESILALMLENVLSPIDGESAEEGRVRYGPNPATTDILHLLAVLARDLRHELHPYLHTKILPRLVDDLLNPPMQKKQSVPLDISIIEACLRTMAYCFRYDAEMLVSETTKEGDQPCLEPMRKYYGKTLAHRREAVRRLSAEAFVPLIRRLPTEASRKRHLKRIFKAMATVSSEDASLQRAQDDAIDGIAKLCTIVVQGVGGRLHSKSGPLIKTILDCCCSKQSKPAASNVLLDIGQRFLSALCNSLKESVSCHVYEQMTALLGKAVKEQSSSVSLFNALQLSILMAEHADGELVRYCENTSDILATLEILLSPSVFSNQSIESQDKAFEFFCYIWKAKQTDRNVANSLSKILSDSIFSMVQSDPTGDRFFVLFTAHILPVLPREIVMTRLGSLLLKAAAKLSNREFLFGLIHSLASVQNTGDEDGAKESDSVFVYENAVECDVSDENIKTLLKFSMIDVNDARASDLELLAASIQCSVFTGILSCGRTGSKTFAVSTYKRIIAWLQSIMTMLLNGVKCDANQDLLRSVCVSVSIYGLSTYSATLRAIFDSWTPDLEVLLVSVREQVVSHLVARPGSLWALKSVASYASELHAASKKLIFENSDDAFDLLVPNLSRSNHFVRLHSLRILATFPDKPFVSNHADLDYTDDLDEEPSESLLGKANTSPGLSGMCRIINTLATLEETPANFQNERKIIALLSAVEVQGRSGKLPVPYLEAAICHMMGLLSVRFSPTCSAIQSAIVSLIRGCDEYAWCHLRDTISTLMFNCKLPENKPTIEIEKFRYSSLWRGYLLWEESGGLDVSLYQQMIGKAEDMGRVSRHLVRSKDDVVLSLWGVLEKHAQIIVTHSRDVAPIILRFLASFFLRKNDPDAVEINLESHLPERDLSEPSLQPSRANTENCMLAILKVTAKVNGPQQMYKHKVLFESYVALLGYSDSLAQSAFLSMLRFKPDYLLPHCEPIKRLFSKGKMREALLQLKEMKAEGVIPSAHRHQLVPVLTRILLGRVSSKNTTRSAKDTPTARRVAIFSFLSGFCDGYHDIYPSIYLSVRQFTPMEFLKTVVAQSDDDRERLCTRMSSLTKNDCEHQPVAVQEGFLNVLEAIISQLGHQILPFVPIFLSIVLSLLEGHAVQAEPSNHGNLGQELQEYSTARSSHIRMLCVRRLSEILDRFASVFDFSATFSRLWDAIEPSLPGLPESAASSGKPPALIILLHTLSSHASLLPALQQNRDAVKALIKSLGKATNGGVIDVILGFIENLLGIDDPEQSQEVGIAIIEEHVDRLLESFQQRMSGSISSATLRREIAVLCGVSNIVVKLDVVAMKNHPIDSLAELMLPYLGLKSRLSEKDRSNVASVLQSLVPGLGENSARRVFQTLSLCLGPAKTGSLSLTAKFEIAKTLQIIASHHLSSAETAANVLVELFKLNGKRVGELDYDSSIIALQKLSKSKDSLSWGELCNHSTEWIVPVVHSCFQFLHDEDGVEARTALKALKDLVALASSKASCDDGENESWMKILEGMIMPLIRSGLKTKTHNVRRMYVQLLSSTITDCRNLTSPHLHTDLIPLTNPKNIDLDFFHGICHVQIHRRAKALTRLRRVLSADEEASFKFSLQSTSLILLPLALHPIYETKTKEEDGFALEAVSTIGVLSRHLSWTKYNNLIGTLLNQFQRHPEQEKYLVGTICSVLDHLNFDLGGNDPDSGSTVLRTIEKRIIPKAEELLTKEVRKGGRVERTIRPSIALALLKLCLRLPRNIFLLKLQQLLTVLCGALKNRDSGIREVARATLAKFAVSMDVTFLATIVRELKISLKEGYQLHVRAASVHSILLELEGKAREQSESAEGYSGWEGFDRAVPVLLDVIQEDLFGVARERRDAEGSQVRYVKEAGGTKSEHSLELIASLVTFAPRNKRHGSHSTVDMVVSAFLERLNSDGGSKGIQRVKGCLDRIAQGFSRNNTLTSENAFGFAYATIKHHIDNEKAIVQEETVGPEALETDSLNVSRSEPKKRSVHLNVREKGDKGTFSEWRPSVQQIPKNEREAAYTRDVESRSLRRIRDGNSAPKLTGSSRASLALGDNNMWNSPSSTAALLFGVQILQIALRKHWRDLKLIEPFVSLLTDCICKCGDNEVLRLSMKCLGTMLNEDLESIGENCSKLGYRTVELLFSSGGSEDVQHACFKLLANLLKSRINERQTRSNEAGLLTDDTKMDLLLSFIKQSIVQSEQHSQAISLLKVIVSRKYTSSDMYDLMECVLEQSVRSPKASLRQQCSAIYLSFLLSYPLTPDRLDQEFKQVLLNVEYEHSDGRLSAINLLIQIVNKLPPEMLHTKSQIFFLPLTMQLANDQSDDCRLAAASCIKSILKLATTEICQSLFEYATRWVKSAENRLRRTALQLYALFIEGVPSFCKQESVSTEVLSTVDDVLGREDVTDWEIKYFALSLLEKMVETLKIDALDGTHESLSTMIIHSLGSDHPWIQFASSRLIWKHLHLIHPLSLDTCQSFSSEKGMLFNLGRSLCGSLANLENSTSESTSDFLGTIRRIMTWLLRAMERFPEFCYVDDSEERKSPTRWVLKRLSGIAKPKHPLRRQAVFQCYLSFAEAELDTILKDNLDCILESVHRVELESGNNSAPSQWQQDRQSRTLSKEAELAQELLHLFESKFEKEFVEVYGLVRRNARDNKEERKRREKAEAARDPRLAAERKIHKNLMGKTRRKRRVDERRRDRGATAKRRYLDVSF